MQATLDAHSVKSLAKAMTCISKYGNELIISATQDALIISTINESKSAFCRFQYDKQFFSKYRVDDHEKRYEETVGELPPVTGQIAIKAFLSILKHKTIEKSLERCVLSIIKGNQDDEGSVSLEHKLIVKLHCKHGVIKTHRLLLSTLSSFIIPGVPQAGHEGESRVTIGPKTLRDLLDHFPVKSTTFDYQLVWTSYEEEITLKTTESVIESRGRNGISTEISLSAEEFENYDPYETPLTVSFHLREFTAALAFADAMSLPLEMRFTDQIIPLVLDIAADASNILFVISMTPSPGGAATVQRSQVVTTKKREREPSTNETPRMKRPMRAAYPVANDGVYDRSGLNSGSMAPPSVIPNHGSSTTDSSHRQDDSKWSHRQYPQQSRVANNQPLFLPSSQLSTKDEEVLRSTGLGIESMNAEELAELLDGEGEEVNFSQPTFNDHFYEHPDNAVQMEVENPDSFELDRELPATQSSQDIHKTFQPLFED